MLQGVLEFECKMTAFQKMYKEINSLSLFPSLIIIIVIQTRFGGKKKKKGKKNQCFPVTPTNNDPSQLNHIRRRKTKSNLKSNWATSIIKTFKS